MHACACLLLLYLHMYIYGVYVCVGIYLGIMFKNEYV